MSWPASKMERHLLGATLQRAVDRDLARAIDCSGAYRDIYFAGYSLSHERWAIREARHEKYLKQKWLAKLRSAQ
jgi:hypothetical protein